MEEKVNIIKMKPEFIYLDNGMAINTDNIVSIDEYNSKVMFGYGVAMFVTSHDIDVIKENIDIINDEPQCHCGQDAEEEACVSLKDLLGMEVVGVCGSKTKCEECQRSDTDCVKIELVGGGYLCLQKPQKDEPDDKKQVISFEEENEDGIGDIMARVKKDTEAFIDYLDDIMNNKQRQ